MLARQTFRRSSNYYLALASEVFRPAIRAYSRWRASGSTTRPAQWQRGVLLGASHIGDVLYRSASLGPLKAGLPDCAWHYFSERGSIPILETNPDLAGVIEGGIPRVGSRKFFELAKRMRAARFDAAICYGTGTYWPELLLAVHAGIPNRVGYVHRGLSGLVTHPISLPTPQSYPAYFRDLVAQLTGQPPQWPLRPVVVTMPEDEAEAGALWQQLALDPNRPVLSCFVTTRQPHGQWPCENYAQTIRRLGERHGAQILLCGGPGDLAVLEGLKAAHGLDCQIVVGRLSLRALVAFLRRCTAVFCPDSGPRHLANAAGVPVLFMRNLWSPKIETGVYLDTEVDLAPDAELVAAGEEATALRNTAPGEVADKIAAHLRLPQP